MKKIYLTAEMTVVRVFNDIVTASGPEVNLGDDLGEDDPIRSPERRYRRNYGNNYNDDFGTNYGL